MAKTNTPANHNVSTNNNVNNNNVNIHITHPETKKETKPNWIIKAIVVGIIGIALTLLGNYIKNNIGGKRKPAIIEDNSHQILKK